MVGKVIGGPSIDANSDPLTSHGFISCGTPSRCECPQTEFAALHYVLAVEFLKQYFGVILVYV